MRTLVNDEEFITAWMEAYKYGWNQRWVQLQLGYKTWQAVSLRSNNMRKRGIKLPYIGSYKQAQKKRLNKQILKDLT